MAAPNEISVPQLLRLIGLADAPLIVDVCTDADFSDDPYLIPGSFRHPHTDIAGLKSRLKGAPCVIVCQKGAKLSQGVTARLRAEGIAAEYLAGGQFAWRDHPQAMRIPIAAVPPSVDGATLRVTRQRPKIDRIACPWLIRRFVDRAARFLFVSPPEAVGLLALSVGLSRQFKDDQLQLEHGLTFYDVLYRWARDGVDEGHDWPAGRSA